MSDGGVLILPLITPRITTLSVYHVSSNIVGCISPLTCIKQNSLPGVLISFFEAQPDMDSVNRVLAWLVFTNPESIFGHPTLTQTVKRNQKVTWWV